MAEIRTEDMYGNTIYPLGETGYGVSLTLHARASGGPLLPHFTVFHLSDGFRQSLFSALLEQPDRAQLSNVFNDRIADLVGLAPHGVYENPHWSFS